jgi:hypothetical protein
MTYDKQYFIAKFSAIPEELWTSGEDFNESTGKCCARGHCGIRGKTSECEEGMALYRVFDSGPNTWPVDINDGHDKRYQQPTPKARILAALNDLP